MARSIRIEIAGGYYHVMARGNRRGAIYTDDDDRRFFLGTLAGACGMTRSRDRLIIRFSRSISNSLAPPMNGSFHSRNAPARLK